MDRDETELSHVRDARPVKHARTFTDASTPKRITPDVARQLLSTMAKAFGWSELDAQRLRPDDQLWAVYFSYNSHLTGWRRWIGAGRPDELEIETLVKHLQWRTGSHHLDLHETVTLGELAKRLRAANTSNG